MSRNNDVRQILVASGNAALLAKNLPVDNLAVGQLGVFDANTELSVDATSTSPRDFYIAIGLDRDGDATQDDINVSAGQYIQRSGVVAYMFREHSAAQPMILEVQDYLAECDTSYAVKLEFRNQQIYRTQGFNQYTKTYAIQTACCDSCETCYSADANEITTKMVAEINLDEENLVTAKAVARQAITIATHGTAANYADGDDITDADIAAITVFNALDTTTDAQKVYTNIVLTTNALAVNTFCSVNLLYFNPRQIWIFGSLVDGFTCASSVAVLQNLAFEEGSGYDVAQKEFHNAGNQQSEPYVVSDSTGVPIGFDSFADKTQKYDVFNIEYNLTSYMNNSPFEAQLATEVAIPFSSTITRDSFAGIMDMVLGEEFTAFDLLADDAAAATATSTVVSPTTAIDDVTLDGIG